MILTYVEVELDREDLGKSAFGGHFGRRIQERFFGKTCFTFEWFEGSDFHMNTRAPSLMLKSAQDWKFVENVEKPCQIPPLG